MENRHMFLEYDKHGLHICLQMFALHHSPGKDIYIYIFIPALYKRIESNDGAAQATAFSSL